MQMLAKLDTNSNINPMFVAHDLDRVLSVAPEEAGNSVSQAMEIKKLNQNMCIVMKTLAEHTDSIGTLFDYQCLRSDKSYAGIAVSGRVGHDPQGFPPLGSRPVPGKPVGSANNIQQQRETSGKDAGSRNNGTPAHSRTLAAAVWDQSYKDNDGFTLPKDQVRRLERQNNSKVVVGKRNDNRLKSGTVKVDIVVSKVSKDNTEDDILNYLIEEDIDVWPEDIHIISHEDHATHTFKIRIKRSDVVKVLNEDFWCEGIESKEYVYRRSISQYQGGNRPGFHNAK